MSLVILNAGQKHFVEGGSDRCQFALAKLLRDRGHQVIPFAAQDARNRNTKWAAYFPPGVDFGHPGLRDLARFIYSRPAAEAMQRLLRDVRIDVAHLHIYYGKLTASILRPLEKAGVPIVQTLHEYKLVCPVYTLLCHGQICEACKGKSFWRAVVKRCNQGSLARSTLSATESYVSRALGTIRKVDRFIAVSDFLRNKVVELGIPSYKVTTVHNFVDATEIKPNTRQGQHFLFLGRLERLKGVLTLVRAAAPLNHIPLLIVGDGKARSEIDALIERDELQHIQVMGFKRGRELADLINDSICVIAPSQWYETFGLVLVEAFAHGRPVIASRIGGMTEVVDHGRDGLLIPPGDAEALREQMAWMAGHREQAVEMGMLGRRKAETLFSPDTHYQKIMNVYRTVM